ncbi:hypothetical protein BX666DRAFT_1877209 [Dichotomocladium elegans]|nr:hypothetical protein BX666DRAFT_1877209 [Dichotomocladium elegans]
MADKYKSLKVKELQELLQKHGLPHSGKKEELIDRLVKFDERNAFESLDDLAGLEEFEESKLDLDSLDPELKILPEESSKSTTQASSKTEVRNTESAAAATSTTTSSALGTSTESKDEKDAGAANVVHKPGSNFVYTPISFGKAKEAPAKVTPPPAKIDEKPKAAAAKNDLEKKLERAKRFNVPLDDQTKMQLRAERFGQGKMVTPSGKAPATTIKGLDPELLKKRAERFGLPLKEDEEEKKRKRAERFGGVAKGDNKKKQRR